MRYVNFANGEPNNSGDNEDCVGLKKNDVSGQWNDVVCETPMRYLCEFKLIRPTIPECFLSENIPIEINPI